MATMSVTTTSLAPLPNLSSTPTALTARHSRDSHYFSESAHWVIPHALMQGERPSDSHEIHDIVERGKCRTFACLQAECTPEEGSTLLGDGGVRDWLSDEHLDVDVDLPSYCEDVRRAVTEADDGGQRRRRPGGAAAAKFLHYGIRDMNPAKSIDGLALVVSELAERIRSGDAVYLHCWGGKGRAGLVASCLLIELYGIHPELALEHVGAYCQLRKKSASVAGETDGAGCCCGPPLASPETEEQKEQVREYGRRRHAGIKSVV